MRALLTAVLIVVICTPALAVKPGYETATLLNASESSDVQVFWQFTLEIRDQVMVADYRPVIPWNFTLLQEFVIHGRVKVRLAGKHVYLARPNGKELKLAVMLRYERYGWEQAQARREAQQASYDEMRKSYQMEGGTLVPLKRGTREEDDAIR